MTKEEIRAIIREHGLEQYESALIASLLETYSLTVSSSVVETSGSKIGGEPSFSLQRWPVDDSGEPLTFLGQIDLTDLPRPDKRVPSTGYLFLFLNLSKFGTTPPELDSQDPDWSFGCAPPGSVPEPKAHTNLPSRPITIAPSLTLPQWESIEHKLGPELLDQYFDLSDEVAGGATVEHDESGTMHLETDHAMLEPVDPDLELGESTTTVLWTIGTTPELQWHDAGTIGVTLATPLDGAQLVPDATG